MPHVRRSMLITIAADADRVRGALVDELELTSTDSGYTGPIHGMPDTTARLDAVVVAEAPGETQVQLDAISDVVVPFYTWFLRIQGWLAADGQVQVVAAMRAAHRTGETIL